MAIRDQQQENLITLGELRGFQGLDGSDPGEVRKALGRLVDHRDEPLVLVERFELGEGVPAQLVVCQARDADATELYVAVTTRGEVIAGHCDRLAKHCRQTLSGFDPIWHEVVAIAVTDQLRLAGDRLDLYIVVRQTRQGEASADATVVYHGLLWVDADGQPWLAPAQDDGQGAARTWELQPAARLPSWLQQGGLTYARGVDPFRERPQLETDLAALVPQGLPPELAVWLPGAFLRVEADEVCYQLREQPTEQQPCIREHALALADRIQCLAAVAEHGQTGGAVRLRGAAGCEDRRLVAFESSGNDLVKSWKQPLPDFPAAVAFVGDETPAGDAWPDVLVALREGSLYRLCYQGGSLRQTWQELWSRLKLDRGQERLRAIASAQEDRSWWQQSQEVRRAWLAGVVEAVLAEADEASPATRQDWLVQVSDCFLPDEHDKVLLGPLRLLLAALGELERRPPWPLEDPQAGPEFLTALLRRIYNHRAQLTVQDCIDQAFRKLGGRELPTGDPALIELCKRASVTRDDLYASTPPEGAPLAERIRRTAVALERWASAYWLGDRLQLPGLADHSVTGLAGSWEPAVGGWLALANRRQLVGYVLTPDAKIGEPLPALPTGKERFELLLRLSPTLLLVADEVGQTLRLISVAVRQEQAGWQLLGNALALPPGSRVAALSSCTSADGNLVGAAACNQGPRSALVLFQVRENALHWLATQELDLPRVSCLDLARATAGGFSLVVGAASGRPCYLYHVAKDGSVQLERRFCLLESGAAAVRFDNPEQPHHVLAGERDGMLWCSALEGSASALNLVWTYQLPGVIRSISAARLVKSSEAAFLIAVEDGSLTLLRARDGYRAWSHRFEGFAGDSLQQLESLDHVRGKAVTVAMSDGWICQLPQTGDENDAFAKVREILNTLQEEPPEGGLTAWKAAGARQVRAMFLLEQQGRRNYLELLGDFHGREPRERILWHLVYDYKERSGTLPPDAGDIVAKFTFRELKLLLYYLQETDSNWDVLVRRELENRPWDGVELSGPNGKRAAVRAMVVWLQRLGRRKPVLLELKALQPPPRFLDFPWVRYEFARLLLEAAQRQLPSTDQEGGGLFGQLLPHLLDLPPEMVGACARVLPYQSVAAEPFETLARTLRSARSGTAVTAADLERLATTLQPLAARSDLVALLGALAWLFQRERQERTEGRLWPQWRSEGLRGLHTLLQQCRSAPMGEQPFLDQLAAGLRALLPGDLPPADSAPLERRLQWFEAAQRRLHGAAPPAAARRHPWQEILARLLALTRLLLERLAQAEIDHLLREVRPRLELQRIERDEHGRLRLQLLAEPEGFRVLRDVSVVFDAGGEHGLLPPGVLQDRQDVLAFPGKFGRRELHFEGLLRPEQKQVAIHVSLQDGEGYTLEADWHFDVPAAPSRATGQLTLAEHLPATFSGLLEAVAGYKNGVVLLGLDGDLGRAAFCREWLQRTGGRQVDLDAAVADVGPGRRYAGRSLDLDLLMAPVADLELHSPEGQPLLLATLDELLERLLQEEVPGLLATWLEQLRQQAARRSEPVWLVVVSSIHLCRLVRLGLGEVKPVAAHRLAGKLPEQTLQRELRSFLLAKLRLPEGDVDTLLEQAGQDFRLLLRWLSRIVPDTGQPSEPLADYLEAARVRELLLWELRALPPFDLLATLAGAEATTRLRLTQVEPGQVAAQSYSAITRSRANPAKLLQAKGAAFSVRSLQQLQADLQPPEVVEVEGFGITGTPTAERTRLLSLVQREARSAREERYRSLASAGFGSWQGQIFRTGPPYRQLICALYAKHEKESAEQRDGLVYEALLGTGASPLASMTLGEVAQLQWVDVKQLIPDLQREDFSRLRSIAEVWAATGEGADPQPALAALFRPWQVEMLQAQTAETWEQPLMLPVVQAFAVSSSGSAGRNGARTDREYVLWLPAGSEPEIGLLSRAVETMAQLKQQEEERNRREKGVIAAGTAEARAPQAPRVVALGPAADHLLLDPSRWLAVLRQGDLLYAFWEGNLVESLRRRARGQLRLTTRSPFRASGGLPPGSPLFVGREAELEYVHSRLRQVSILIVGGRRVGKTSLLNQVRHWVGQQPDLVPVFVDLQDCGTRNEFAARLARGLREPALRELFPEPQTHARLEDVVAAAQAAGRLPVFLFNEVDELAKRDAGFVASWRGFNDQHQARFVLVGYSVVGSLGHPRSPFFHFTEGTKLGGKAIVLDALAPAAAEKLLDLLEHSDLELRWRSEDERKAAYRLCLQRSYRIPWVLQRFGQILVEHLENQRRIEITYEDVAQCVERSSGVIWQYVDGIQYQELGRGPNTTGNRPGFRLVLFALARQRYFLGARPAIHEPRLAERDPLASDLGFTVGDAHRVVKETVLQLLVGREREAVELWLNRLDLPEALRLLTLTLTLEPDPKIQDRYGFLLHILPLELLHRYGDRDPTLDSLIVDQALELWHVLEEKKKEVPQS